MLAGNNLCKLYKEMKKIPKLISFDCRKEHPDGYEQFGTLMGFVKGDSFPEEMVRTLSNFIYAIIIIVKVSIVRW